jgi:hypothetical protein
MPRRKAADMNGKLWATLQPWKSEEHVSSKHWALLSELHGVTTQKTAIFTVTNVRTSNPTHVTLC